MKKMQVLITTPQKIHKKEFQYLDHGSLNIKFSESQKNVIFKHSWDDAKNYTRDFKEIKKKYSYFLNKFTTILNDHHNINRDIKYWKIILGPWMYGFIVSYYEKSNFVKKLIKYKKKLLVPILDSKQTENIPKSFYQWFSRKTTSTMWNNYLFTEILSQKKLGKNFKLKKIKLLEKKLPNQNNSNIKTFFRDFMMRLLSFSFSFLIKKQTLVFLNPYLPKKIILNLMFKYSSFPISIKFKNNFVKPDLKLRNNLIEKSKNNIKRDSQIFNLLLKNIPTDFLESFSQIEKDIQKSYAPLKPKIIITANGMYHSSHNTRYIAECVSKGTKLIIIQHGGRYGSLKNFAQEEHEIEISDYFLSWYKKNKVRNLNEIKGTIKSIGFIKQIIKLSKSQKIRIKDKILFVMYSRGRYLRFADSELNLKHIYNYYSQVCPNFYTNLNEDLKKKLSYRLNIRNNWNELELLKEKCSLATLEYKHRLDFSKSVSSAKIVVCSYFSTTFLELMAANLPVILFSNFSLESYNNDTIKSFKDMKKNKIYFDDFKKAATFINNNWYKISEWWYSKNVQKSRKKFINQFAILNPDLEYDINKLTLKLK